jgi:hypothetical protein
MVRLDHEEVMRRAKDTAASWEGNAISEMV